MGLTTSRSGGPQDWPALSLHDWIDTRDTLHMWLQIAGKVRLRLTPPINHSWHATFYLTSRGITTSPIPHGSRSFQIDFDFVDHRLIVAANDGRSGGFPLEPQPVAAFYARLMEELTRLELPVRISARPNEVADAIPFPGDETHRAYDADAVNRFWRALAQADRVFKIFRGRFIGKCSPVHLFWGAMDLAVTRFSGRPAPEHPGGIPNLPDRVTREAYSHEVSSCGFWPGTAPIDYPAFYSYAYPAAGGVWRRAGAAGRGVLQQGVRRVHPAVRSRARVANARRDAAGVPPVHVRAGRRSGPLGSACDGTHAL